MGERLSVPKSASEITSAWLSQSLNREVLGPIFVKRIGEAYGFMSEVYRCGFSSEGSERTVVVKLWSTDGPGGESEVRFFQFVAERLTGIVPTCYYADSDEDSQRAVLILDDLKEAVQGDCLDIYSFDQAKPIAKVLARIHAEWWNSNELREQSWLRTLPAQNRDEEWFSSRKELFLQKYSDIASDTLKNLIARPQFLQQRMIERLDHFPNTLLHADFHLDNVLFRKGTGEPVVLDWALVASGPSVLDVAALCFDIGESECQANVASAYHRYLSDLGIEISMDKFMEAMGGALIFRLIACTFGTARWEPKTERELRIVRHTMNRLSQAIESWESTDPELLR